MKQLRFCLVFFAVFIGLVGCKTLDSLQEDVIGTPKNSSTEAAKRVAEVAIDYINAKMRVKSNKTPMFVILPGSIKSSNATFTQQVTQNNIADYAELELGKANFRVLERSNLGPMLGEIQLAANMGDTKKLRDLMSRGTLEATRWFLQFDVLKAEPVGTESTSINLSTITNILGFGGRGGQAVSSINKESSGGTWMIGMRYKLIDAKTTEQVDTNYFEEKLEIGSSKGCVAGICSGGSQITTLDSLVQLLIKKSVADIDKKNPPR